MNEIVLLLMAVVGVIIAVLIFFDFDEKLAKKEENRIGKLIVVEGIEGSGKSELLQLMKEVMPIEWAYTKEPYYVAGSTANWTKENFQLDRETHVQNKILPLLQQNRVVITNRYWMSGCVYDGWEAESYLNIWPEPDLVIWLHGHPTEIAAEQARVPVKVLAELNNSYGKLLSKLESEHHFRVVSVDTAELTSEEILAKILPEIKKQVHFDQAELKSIHEHLKAEHHHDRSPAGGDYSAGMASAA
jgi:thymidylate kinase